MKERILTVARQIMKMPRRTSSASRENQFYPILTCKLFHPYHLKEPISSFRGFVVNVFILIEFCIEISVSK